MANYGRNFNNNGGYAPGTFSQNGFPTGQPIQQYQYQVGNYIVLNDTMGKFTVARVDQIINGEPYGVICGVHNGRFEASNNSQKIYATTKRPCMNEAEVQAAMQMLSFLEHCQTEFDKLMGTALPVASVTSSLPAPAQAPVAAQAYQSVPAYTAQPAQSAQPAYQATPAPQAVATPNYGAQNYQATHFAPPPVPQTNYQPSAPVAAPAPQAVATAMPTGTQGGIPFQIADPNGGGMPNPPGM